MLDMRIDLLDVNNDPRGAAEMMRGLHPFTRGPILSANESIFLLFFLEFSSEIFFIRDIYLLDVNI